MYIKYIEHCLKHIIALNQILMKSFRNENLYNFTCFSHKVCLVGFNSLLKLDYIAKTMYLPIL